MNHYSRIVRNVLISIFMWATAFLMPCRGMAASTYLYQSFHQFSQTYVYCSANSCTGGQQGVYPCSGTQYQCSDIITGFHDQFDLYNPKLFCQLDTAQAPDCVADPASRSWDIDDQTIPSYLRIYIPAGAEIINVTLSKMGVTSQLAAVSQFGTPPEGDIPTSYSGFSFTPGDKFYAHAYGAKFSELQAGPQFSINGGNIIMITANEKLPSTLANGGWLYIRLLSYDGSAALQCKYTIMFDKTIYLGWYNPDAKAAIWDVYGDPVQTTSSLKITPSSLNFGNVPINTISTPQQIVIANSGTTALTVNSLLASNTVFSVDWSSGNIAAGANQTVNVTFLPTAAQNYTATLTATSASGNATATLSGIGVAAANPLNFNPSSLSFGNVAVNTKSTPQQIVIANSGTTALTVSLQPSNTAFSVDWSSGDIAAGANKAVNVTFSPAAVQNYTATLTATSASGNATATLTGTGIAPTKQLDVSTTALNFATVWRGESSPLSFTLTNSGSGNVTVSSIDPDNSAFVVDWNGGVIKPGTENAKTVNVKFQPIERKPYSGRIPIKSDGGDITVNVSGRNIGEKVAVVKGNFSDALKLAEVALKPDKTYTPIKFLSASGGNVTASFSSTSEFSASNPETAYLTGNYSDFDITVGKFADADDYDRVLMAKTDMNGNIQVSIVNTDGSYQDIALSDGGPKNLFGIRVAAGNFNPSGDSSRSDFLIGGIGNNGNYQINFYKYTGELITSIPGTTPCSAFAVGVGKFASGDMLSDIVIAMQNTSGTLSTQNWYCNYDTSSNSWKWSKISQTDGASSDIVFADINVGVLPPDPTGVNTGYIVSGRGTDGKLALVTFDNNNTPKKVSIADPPICNDVHLSTSMSGAAVSLILSSKLPGVYLFDQNLTGKGSWAQGKTSSLTTDIVYPDSAYGISSPVLVYLDSSGNLQTIQTPVQ